LRAPAQPKPPPKPKLAQTDDPYWLSFAYRIEPGPADKSVRDIVNLLFQLKPTYPSITLPEAVFWYLCVKGGVNFVYQADFNGGRADLGGAVPDFWLEDYRIVILINGLYWHDNAAVAERDLQEVQRMSHGTIDGAPINAVVRISDMRIQSLQRAAVFALALTGVEQYP
jgi:hypothetical protein